ncbi:hypothetical protein [Cysteiniphilum marinum]|uniref:hypothetical protein n=1 Tax=Cysteiniphilum marinum TaxID=2774191 RepID=UPI00193A2F20|nr:hypothetical protein [Cysteiniphilum marinum]
MDEFTRDIVIIDKKVSKMFDANLPDSVILDICKDDMPIITKIIQSYNQSEIDRHCQNILDSIGY